MPKLFGIDLDPLLGAMKQQVGDLLPSFGDTATTGQAAQQVRPPSPLNPFEGLSYGGNAFDVRAAGGIDPLAVGDRWQNPDPLMFGGGSTPQFAAFWGAKGRRDNEVAAAAAKAATSATGPGATGTSTGAGASPAVAKWATKAQQTFGDIIDPDVMLAIMTNESGGDPNAYNAAGDAWGLFQQVGLKSNDPDTQFAGARQLAQQKMASIAQSYAANGLNPDERTRARDFALAWAGHFDYGTGRPNPTSRDVGSGQTADQLSNIFLGNYDRIKAAGKTGVPTGHSGTVPTGTIRWDGASGALATGQQYLGRPYVWGGASPVTSFDCSGLTQYAFAQQGVNLPRTAQQQYDATQRIGAGDLQPNDLVFFTNTYETNEAVTHVGIFAGYDPQGHPIMLNAADGGVLYAPFDGAYWSSHIYGYGRVKK